MACTDNEDKIINSQEEVDKNVQDEPCSSTQADFFECAIEPQLEQTPTTSSLDLSQLPSTSKAGLMIRIDENAWDVDDAEIMGGGCHNCSLMMENAYKAHEAVVDIAKKVSRLAHVEEELSVLSKLYEERHLSLMEMKEKNNELTKRELVYKEQLEQAEEKVSNYRYQAEAARTEAVNAKKLANEGITESQSKLDQYKSAFNEMKTRYGELEKKIYNMAKLAANMNVENEKLKEKLRMFSDGVTTQHVETRFSEEFAMNGTSHVFDDKNVCPTIENTSDDHSDDGHVQVRNSRKRTANNKPRIGIRAKKPLKSNCTSRAVTRNVKKYSATNDTQDVITKDTEDVAMKDREDSRTINVTEDVAMNDTEDVTMKDTEHTTISSTEDTTFNVTEDATLNDTEDIAMKDAEDTTVTDSSHVSPTIAEQSVCPSIGNTAADDGSDDGDLQIFEPEYDEEANDTTPGPSANTSTSIGSDLLPSSIDAMVKERERKQDLLRKFDPSPIFECAFLKFYEGYKPLGELDLNTVTVESTELENERDKQIPKKRKEPATVAPYVSR
ncbi:unnamed protein product [Bursaphelenchus okinawaensis]|uniref:Uncharacterized protein n=1 Tax=Bursaphelenchus okinawaensis TaxID=465554 RepID=A0A811KZ73_9BILA|nr:unnamed protein product [Bursaphelenchus okinawaensis]CAG9113321.1 unnamed protein product [Bursaphelenchus okinawaensis]